MEKLVRTVLVVFFLLGIASAQSIPEIDIFGGFSYLSFDLKANQSTGAASNRLAMVGADASVAVHVWHRFSAEADFGLHENNNSTISSSSVSCDTNNLNCKDFSFMAGPRYSFGSDTGHVTSFVHGLIGKDSANLPLSGSIVSSDSAMAFAVGGGANYWFSHHIGVGGEGDWFYTNHLNNYSVPSQTASFRASAGLVFRFGGETSGGERAPRSRREVSSSRPNYKSRPVPEAQPVPTTFEPVRPVQSLVATPGHGLMIVALGASVVPQEFDGAKILEIVPGSVAEMSSLKAGDLIKSVDGKAVKTPMEFVAEMSDKTGKVRIGIQRGDVSTEVLILIGR